MLWRRGRYFSLLYSPRLLVIWLKYCSPDFYFVNFLYFTSQKYVIISPGKYKFSSHYSLEILKSLIFKIPKRHANLQLTLHLHSPNLLLDRQIRENLLTPAPNNHDSNIPANLLNP